MISRALSLVTGGRGYVLAHDAMLCPSRRDPRISSPLSMYILSHCKEKHVANRPFCVPSRRTAVFFGIYGVQQQFRHPAPRYGRPHLPQSCLQTCTGTGSATGTGAGVGPAGVPVELAWLLGRVTTTNATRLGSGVHRQVCPHLPQSKRRGIPLCVHDQHWQALHA